MELWSRAFTAIQQINPKVAYPTPITSDKSEAGLIRRLRDAIREMDNAEVANEYQRLSMRLSPNFNLALHCRAIIEAVGFEQGVGPMKRLAAFHETLDDLNGVFPWISLGVSKEWKPEDAEDQYLTGLLEGFIQNTDEKFVADYNARRRQAKSFLDIAKIVTDLVKERTSV